MSKNEVCVVCDGGVEPVFTEAGSDTCGSCHVAEFRRQHPDAPVPSVAQMLESLTPAAVDVADDED